MPILLLPPPPILSTADLEIAARRQGWQVEKPADGMPPHRLAGRDDLVFYGDWRVVTAWANTLHQFLLGPNVSWLPQLPDRYLRRRVDLINWQEVLRLTEPAFIKPATTKGYAKVYASGAELPDPESRPPSDPMLVSEPVVWDLELRCFVRERSVAAVSPYYRGGRVVIEPGVRPAQESEVEGALEFANTLLGDPEVAVPPAFVMDVGWIEGRGWAVVEAGPAWFCARYFCEPSGVLAVLRRACVSAYRIKAEDEPWIVRFGLGVES